MAGLGDYHVMGLIILCLVLQTQSQKILSDRKKCGDSHCESMMMRVSAKQDYTGPDCRFLSFKTGDEINVYYKLTGEREDLWQGSKGKAYGFFPKDMASIEEVYMTEEVEVPAQEIDFICLNGGEYFFENEDSVLHKENEDRLLTGENTAADDGVPADITQQQSEQETTDKSAWPSSGIAGWFGMGRADERQDTMMEDNLKTEDGFLNRNTAFNEQGEPKELEETQTEKSGWFGGRIKKFLPFREKNTEAEPQEEDSDTLVPHKHIAVETDGENISTHTQEPNQESNNSNDRGESQSKWFNFAIKDVLGFGSKNNFKKEEFHQSEDESDNERTSKNLSTDQGESMEINAEGDKEVFVVDQPTVDETKTPAMNPEMPTEDIAVTTGPEKVEVSTQCESEETASSEHCTFESASDLPYREPHYPEESCTAGVQPPSDISDISILPFTVKELMSSFWKYYEVLSNFVGPVGSAVTNAIHNVPDFIYKVVSLLPEDLQPGQDFYGCSWEVVIFTACFGFLSVFLFTCRTIRCIKSRCYASRECKLGAQVTELLNNKSEVLEKLSIVQKQYEEVQQTLEESGQQKLLLEISEQKALQESLQVSNTELEENIARLEQELEEEKQRGPELDNMLVELNEKIKNLEDNFKKEKSQKEEIRTTQKVFEINKERLELSCQDAKEEQSRLQESIKQLSEEAEGWEERFSELSENSRMLSVSAGPMQEDLSNKQCQIKSLVDSLLTMKDWISEVDELYEDDDTISSIKWDFENGEPLGDPQKQTIKKLIFAAMLNASLKSVESEKKQLYDNLSDEMKAKEQLAECITNLQNSNQSMALEKEQLDGELEKLKQKMSVMMEVYQENERKLHRKLTVQEKERIQKEAKLCKADEKMNLAAGELVTVKTRVAELEDETERTVSSYQSQVTSYEKKSHDNWLTARAAERYLSDVKKEAAHLRQKLTEAEYKLELLEKDPFALDVIQAISRDGSPYGLSPIGRLPESRAFLSPPTLLEGPLRISPMLPTADRGPRLPGYYPAYLGPKERGDINADRKSDHQRTLSDSGSLSPPWDREQKNVPPPGLPYPEHHFPQRRAERFYHYPPPSGRFSGPAELTRNQGKPFMDAPDGRFSPEYKQRVNTSRNGTEEANNAPGAPNQESEAPEGPPSEYPMHPPPPMRVPLLPMDPRAPYFRRPFPMPPPPMDMYGPPGYPGMPPPHITMRSPLPPHPQHFSAYPMHSETFFPPQHLRPPPRNDHLTDTLPSPGSDSTQDKPSDQKT
ncbi:melanoma inhibitory activity protein 2 isoform X2 [Pseudophryne corroboree]|uniref:melanoma inhibitory activity protein 2 isoform X2 n=1 Tax=Pseudophryne corroboree TaxID=495146 RepID=UPI00308184FB